MQIRRAISLFVAMAVVVATMAYFAIRGTTLSLSVDALEEIPHYGSDLAGAVPGTKPVRVWLHDSGYPPVFINVFGHCSQSELRQYQDEHALTQIEGAGDALLAHYANFDGEYPFHRTDDLLRGSLSTAKTVHVELVYSVASESYFARLVVSRK